MNGRSFSGKRYRKWVMPVLLLAILAEAAALVCGVRLGSLGKSFISGFSFLAGAIPPDWGAFPELLRPALESVVIALTGTLVGTLVSLLFGLAAASNISPAWLKQTTRLLLGMERSLPEIVILLFLVAAFGLGPFAGVLALTIGCVGMLGKLIGDAIEEIDPVTVESIQAVGAGKLQVMVFGIVQQIIPSVISFALFRFELSIRLSIVLGAVGAGGIGLELYRSFYLLDYHRACSALIVTLVMVLATERLSAFLRKQVRKEGALR